MPRLTAFVLGALCACACLAPAASGPPSHLLWGKCSESRFAYGMYFKDKKVGWIVEELKLGRHNGQPVLYSTSESYMATLFDGEKSVKEEKSLTCYELTGQGEILFASSTRKDDGSQVTRQIDRDPSKRELRITTKQGGRTLVRTVPMPRDTLAHHRQLEGWLRGPRKKGDVFDKYNAVWDEADVNSKQVYHFKEGKTLLLSGLPTKVCGVVVDLEGGKMDAVMLPDGRTITATMGGLLTIRLEKEAAARKLDGKPIDLMDITSISVNRRLGRARLVDRLELELTGVADMKVPASHRQRVKPGKGSVAVELLRDYRAGKAAPLTKAEKVQYLRATPRVQCDHEAVKVQAKKIVGEEKDALKAARKIEAWVYNALRKSYSDNADTALEVLDSKAGDCTEHALLFVALARAAGVPAREVGGLAYLDSSKPTFGWHAWAEVHDGHQWVSVDPTWNQVYVDATHLKMSDGERDLAWTNVIGTIKIKVVDFKAGR